MKKYDSYKDSGIEWIGEIPEHWEINNFQILAKEEKYSFTGGPFGSDLKFNDYTEVGVRIIQLQNIGDGLFNNEYKIFTSNDKADQLISCNIFPNEIIIAKMADPVARACFIPDFDSRFLMASDGIRLAVNENRFNSKFVLYGINSNYFRIQAEMNSSGSTRLRIGLNTLKKLKFILPSLQEQTTIANYLDHKTTQIDTLIAKKEQFISLLQEERTAVINQAVTKGLDPNVKMKDSGIEWLGEIPEHWEVKKLAFEFNTLNTKRVPLSAEERGKMESRIYDYYGASGVIDKVENYIFDEELILIGEDGANLLTRTKRLAFIASGRYWVNNHAHIIKPINGNIYYFCELLELIDYTIYISGSAQPKLTQEALMSIKIPVPPISEQNKIFDYLKDEFNKIDTIISKSQQEIELLKEYKTALISEVVTGKVDVRDVILN